MANESRAAARPSPTAKRAAAQPAARFPFVGLWLAVVVGMLLAAGAAAAEPHRIEVVGIYRIRDAVRGKLNPRDEAIQQALWEGVSRVALELIGDEDASAGAFEEEQGPGAGANAADEGGSGAPEGDASARFREVLGREILPYTRSFRILEDRGERPVLFADEPGVRSEYLVVVEVLVDVARLRAELSRAGMLEPSGAELARQRITIELIGLEQHAGLRRVLETLRSEIGASRIETLEFSPARQLLSVETPLGPQEVVSRLAAVDAPDLILDPAPVEMGERRLRILAQWIPSLPAEAPVAPNGDGMRAPASAGR